MTAARQKFSVGPTVVEVRGIVVVVLAGAAGLVVATTPPWKVDAGVVDVAPDLTADVEVDVDDTGTVVMKAVSEGDVVVVEGGLAVLT